MAKKYEKVQNLGAVELCPFCTFTSTLWYSVKHETRKKPQEIQFWQFWGRVRPNCIFTSTIGHLENSEMWNGSSILTLLRECMNKFLLHLYSMLCGKKCQKGKKTSKSWILTLLGENRTKLHISSTLCYLGKEIVNMKKTSRSSILTLFGECRTKLNLHLFYAIWLKNMKWIKKPLEVQFDTFRGMYTETKKDRDTWVFNFRTFNLNHW